MNIKHTVYENELTVTYKLSEVEMEILNYIKDLGLIQFRKSHSDTESDYSSRFKRSDCVDLINYEFMIQDYDSWHDEYRLGNLGKMFFE